MILCLGTTPAAQRVMVFRKLEVNEVNRAVTALDGAAGKSVNVAKVLKCLGDDPVAVGVLGGDRGEEVSSILRQKGIRIDFVRVLARTRQCITAIDEGRGTQTELVQESEPITPDEQHQLVATVARHIQSSQAVVMSGTLAPGLALDFYGQCTRLANEAGALAGVDAQGASLKSALQWKAGLVKLNRAELSATLGRPLSTEADLLDGMEELHRMGAERIIVTAGKAPTFAFDGTCVYRVQPPRVDAVNPIGSGDAFTAAAVSRLVRGHDLGDACRWGNAAGAANALQLMPGELRREDVEDLVQDVLAEQVR